jgi:hypothetical protein
MNKHWRKPKGQSRMNNPEKLATSARQDTWWRQTMQNTQHTKPNKKTNIGQQNTTQKTKDLTTRTTLKATAETKCLVE